MARQELRYNISNWNQLSQCLSNISNSLHIRVRNSTYDKLEGTVIEVYHDDLGVLFSYLVDGRGDMLDARTSNAPDMTVSELLDELSRFGFLVTFNRRAYLSEDQLNYLRTLLGLGLDKLRLLYVYQYTANGLKISEPHIVAFNVEPNPGWLDNTYTASLDEFHTALSNGSAVDLDDVSDTKRYRWDWLDYVANIQDIIDDNDPPSPPGRSTYTKEEIDELLSKKLDNNKVATYSELGSTYVASFDDIQKVEDSMTSPISPSAIDLGQGFSYQDAQELTVLNIQHPGWAAEDGIYMFTSSGISSVKINEEDISQSYAIEGSGVIVYLSSLKKKVNSILIEHGLGTASVTINNINGEEDPTQPLDESPKFINPYHLLHHIKRWWDNIRKKPTFLGASVVDDRLEVTGGLTVGGQEETILGGEGNLTIAGGGNVTVAKSGSFTVTSPMTTTNAVTMNRDVTINAPVTMNGGSPTTVNHDIIVNGEVSTQRVAMGSGEQTINIGNNFVDGVSRCIVVGEHNAEFPKGSSTLLILGTSNLLRATQNSTYPYACVVVGDNNRGISSIGQVIIGDQNTISSYNEGNTKLTIVGDSNNIRYNGTVGLVIVGTNNKVGSSNVHKRLMHSLVLGANHLLDSSYSLVSGRDNISNAEGQFISGYFNEADSNSLAMIGNGVDENNRSNAFKVTKSGDVSFSGELFKIQKITDVDYDFSNVTETATQQFTLNADGYYVSGNKGISNSFALCTITMNEDYDILAIDYINSGESAYDFGIFSKPNCPLQSSHVDDAISAAVYKSCKGQSSTNVKTLVYYDIKAGDKIYIKYRKDSGVNQGNDSLQFKVSYAQVVNNYVTQKVFDTTVDEVKTDVAEIQTNLENTDNKVADIESQLPYKLLLNRTQIIRTDEVHETINVSNDHFYYHSNLIPFESDVKMTIEEIYYGFVNLSNGFYPYIVIFDKDRNPTDIIQTFRVNVGASYTVDKTTYPDAAYVCICGSSSPPVSYSLQVEYQEHVDLNIENLIRRKINDRHSYLNVDSLRASKSSYAAKYENIKPYYHETKIEYYNFSYYTDIMPIDTSRTLSLKVVDLSDVDPIYYCVFIPLDSDKKILKIAQDQLILSFQDIAVGDVLNVSSILSQLNTIYPTVRYFAIGTQSSNCLPLLDISTYGMNMKTIDVNSLLTESEINELIDKQLDVTQDDIDEICVL